MMNYNNHNYNHNNNNNHNHKPNNKKGGNNIKKQQLQQLFKPRPKPKPGWDDSINDLTAYKLSKDELEARKKSYQSGNADRARVELYERKPSPQLPSFFQHLDAQIEDLIHGRVNGKRNSGPYMNEREDEYFSEEEGDYQQDMPNSSRFSVVPEVTLAPNSRKNDVQATPHPVKKHVNYAQPSHPEDEENASDQDEEQEDEGPPASEQFTTPKQQPRSNLRPTPLPSNTPSPHTYNTPPIDPQNVMWFYDNPNENGPNNVAARKEMYNYNRPISAHVENHEAAGGKPAHKKEPSNSNLQPNSRPNSAGSRFNTSGHSVDLEEEIENFKKANANANKARPTSAKGKRTSASKPPLRPNNSFQNTSSDNLANLNSSFTNNLSHKPNPPNHPHTQHTNFQNGNVPHNRQPANDTLDAARELSFQIDQFERMRVNVDPEERKTFNHAREPSQFINVTKFNQHLAECEEQRKEDAQQKALLWEAIQKQISKIAELEQTVSSLRREKDDLQHYFMTFQQVTSEKFILVQQVLAQYVRSAELDKLSQATSHQPSRPPQPSNTSHQQPLPHPQHPSTSPRFPSSLPPHPPQPQHPSQQPQQQQQQQIPQQHLQQQQQTPQQPHYSQPHPLPPSLPQPTQSQPHPKPQDQHQPQDYYSFFNPHKSSPQSSVPNNTSPNSNAPQQQYEKDTSDYNEYSKALLERQRKLLVSPQSQRSSFLGSIPQLKGEGNIKDVEVVEGPRKVPAGMRAQQNPTYPLV